MPRAHAFLMVMSRRRAETCRTHHFGWGTPRLVGSSPALGRAARVTCSHDVRRNPLVTRSAASISQIIRVANMMWSPIYCAGRSKQAFRFPQPPHVSLKTFPACRTPQNRHSYIRSTCLPWQRLVWRHLSRHPQLRSNTCRLWQSANFPEVAARSHQPGLILKDISHILIICADPN